MKRIVIVLVVLVFMFTIGFVTSDILWGKAKSYEPGTDQNPLATESYLEEAVQKKLAPLQKELESLKERINNLQKQVK